MGGGVPSTKNFFSSLNMYQAKSGVKNFSLYRWGGVPRQKIFFPSLNMYQAKSGVKIFSLYRWGGGQGGSLNKKFFFQSEHVSSQIWCQNFFPLPWREGSLNQKFFSSLNMYQAKSGVKIFSLYCGGEGVPQPKNFFSRLNMYQAKSGVKNFSLYWWGGPSTKKFFFQSEHISSQIWCQNFFPLPWREGP